MYRPPHQFPINWRDVFYGNQCPYCTEATRLSRGWAIKMLLNGSSDYLREELMDERFPACMRCRAFVPAESMQPVIGGVATEPDRLLRDEAIILFNNLVWLKHQVSGVKMAEAKRAGLEWLVSQVNRPEEYCRISMMYGLELRTLNARMLEIVTLLKAKIEAKNAKR